MNNPEKASSDRLVCAGGQSEHMIDPTLAPYNPCLTYLHFKPWMNSIRFCITVNSLNRGVILRKLDTIPQMSAVQYSQFAVLEVYAEGCRKHAGQWNHEENKVRLQNITARKRSRLSSIQELPEKTNFW